MWPQHSDYTPDPQAPIAIDPPEDNDSTASNSPVIQTTSVITLPSTTHHSTSTPGLTITSTSTTHTPQASSTIPPHQPTHMSASATGTGGQSGGGGGGGGGSIGRTGTAPIPSNGGMRGVPPAIFNGTWALADEFWAQFRWYKMVNRTHDSMAKPFNRVLTALTYIWGPMINDLVNTQETHLSNHTDTTKPNAVHEDGEVLWMEFKTAFTNAWTDTLKKQNTYDQLMKLTMASWDIDTYVATFERLALTAGWTLDAKGTIVRFREGLSKGIHSKALDRDKIPCTMDEWKAAACTKVARAKEKYNMGCTMP